MKATQVESTAACLAIVIWASLATKFSLIIPNCSQNMSGIEVTVHALIQASVIWSLFRILRGLIFVTTSWFKK